MSRVTYVRDIAPSRGRKAAFSKMARLSANIGVFRLHPDVANSFGRQKEKYSCFLKSSEAKGMKCITLVQAVSASTLKVCVYVLFYVGAHTLG